MANRFRPQASHQLPTLVGGGRNKPVGPWKAFHSLVLSPPEALTTPAFPSLLWVHCCLQASLSHLYARDKNL